VLDTGPDKSMEAALVMQATRSAVHPSRVGVPEALQPAGAEETSAAASSTTTVQAPVGDGAPKGLWNRILPLRLFAVRVVSYLTNHVVTHVPSFTFRHLWYRVALGIQIERRSAVYMGTYVWFNGLRDTRRAVVKIGRNSFVNRNCTIDVRAGLTIGDYVSISPEVMILGGTHDLNDPEFGAIQGPVTIEDYVFVGSRAMIFHGVTLGRGAVIAAGSVVTKDVAPMMIVAGAPARPIGMRDPNACVYELGPAPLFQ